MENLLASWQEFLRGKRKRKDVAEFSVEFMDNISELHLELMEKTYRHGGYHAFKINDPKPRDIHKASVRDRLVHHAIYRALYRCFDRKFIHDSYSCRIGKGTHKAINRFKSFAGKVSENNTKTCWVLKCDIRKFFASIDHEILKNILVKNIKNKDTLWLFGRVIDSFQASGKSGVGLPLGNLTSQLLVNIYMNEFDQFAKQTLKTKYYIRYADDFVVLSQDKKWLENLLSKIECFLYNKLKLELHPNKVSIQTSASGVDFLGWVHFPNRMILRTTTKRRMLKRLKANKSNATLTSYVGLLGHGDTYGLTQKIQSCMNKKN